MPELSKAELDSRHEGMGSTDVVEVCGLAPWDGAGPWRVYNLKTGVSVPEPATPEMRWGHWQEALILDWYKNVVTDKVLPAGQVRSNEHDWLWATLDGIVLGSGKNIECKNVGSPALYRHWDTYADDGVPGYVRAQVQIGMHVRGVLECDVVAAIGGRPPHVWTIGYDRELAEMLVSRAERFWWSVRNRHTPEVDDSQDIREYLESKWPVDKRPMLQPSEAIDAIAQQRIKASLDEERAVSIKRECDTRLMIGLEDARGWDGDGWSFTWKIGRGGNRATRFTVK